MLALKEFRSQAKGFSDLLNYAALIDDGIVLNKDGSLLAGFFYAGHDVANMSKRDRNTLAAKINNVLIRLGSGWATHHDAIRIKTDSYSPYANSHFPDKISRLIDEERRKFYTSGNHFESVYAMTITYLPPDNDGSKLSRYFIDDETNTTLYDETQETINYFKKHLESIEDSLSSIIRIERMREHSFVDEFNTTHTNSVLLQYINYCITGNNQPIKLPPCPMYLDAILGNQDFVSGTTPKIGDRYIGVVAIDGFPLESTPNMLTYLDQLPVQYRWSNRMIYLDEYQAHGQLKKFRAKWRQKMRPLLDQLMKKNNGIVDHDAVEMASDSESAMSESSSGFVKFGFYTAVIILMSKSIKEVDLAIVHVKKAIEACNFVYRVETVNAIEAYLGSLPAHCVQNIRRPIIHTLNLADFLPLSSIYAGEFYCPNPMYPMHSPALIHATASGSTPFRLNLHVGDLGHSLMFGYTSSGKSTALALIASQFLRYPQASVFAFDKGGSLLPLTLAVGGKFYNVCADDSSLSFCPLGQIKSKSEIAWACDWIEILLRLQEVSVTPKHRQIIKDAMTLHIASPHKTMTDFVTNIQDGELREALSYYTMTGQMPDLDAEHDSLDISNFSMFEIEHLMGMDDRKALPVLLYLFFRIEKRLKGQPALLILDEAWLFLGHTAFREKIVEWFKVLRKANCVVLLATQSPFDAEKKGILDVMIDSCPTKILLPNPNADVTGSNNVRGQYELYRTMGLNDAQISIIKHAVPKRQYYIHTPNGSRLIEFSLGDVALSFVGASSKKDLARVKELQNKYAHEWPYKWMDERGVNYARYQTN